MTLPPPTHDSFTARVLRAASPGWGFCLRCGWPWNHTEPHSTNYVDPETGWNSRGIFPLCERCWTELGHPEARIPYYDALVTHWEDQGVSDPHVRAEIGRAVANEPITRVDT